MQNTNDYDLVLLQTAEGWSGYVPALPGCVASGVTYGETKDCLRAAIDFHFFKLDVMDDEKELLSLPYRVRWPSQVCPV